MTLVHQRFCSWMISAGIMALALPILSQVPVPASFPGAGEMVSIDLPSATLDQAIALYANLTRRTAIRASTLQGRITLQGNGPLSREDAVIALENVFLANGFAVIKQGDKFFKVVQAPAAKQEGIGLSTEGETLVAGDRLVSRMFQLKYMDAKDVQPVLQPMLHSFGQMTLFPRTNTLLVTDSSANLIEMKHIIDRLDLPLEAKVKTKFYPLKHGKAKDVAARIMELLSANGSASTEGAGQIKTVSNPGQTAPPPPAGTGAELVFNEEAVVVGKVNISADERTNQIILLTREVNFPFFDQMIEKLDADTARPILLRRIPLKYAEAEALAELLGEILSPDGGEGVSPKRQRIGDKKFKDSKDHSGRSSVASGEAPASAGAKKGDEDLSVHADTRTNSLIALGVMDRIEWVENFVHDVDVPLPQVLLQGVVVEVTLNRSDTLGVEVLAKGRAGDFSQAGLLHSLVTTPVNPATVSVNTVPSGVTPGLNYFLALKNTQMDVLIQALAANSNVRILSQPLIQTSHNEEAKIIVGQRVPIVTATETVPGAAVATTSTNGVPITSSTLRSQYEMTDVALELTIKPLVNPGGLVVLDILQKIDDISGFQIIDGNQVPIISRREANAVVSVRDGEMIILGGLISNREDLTKTGVPLLSDIPLLGYLFSSTTKKKNRTEMMLLLRPTVLNTPQEASEEARQRRKQLELYNRKDFLQKRSLNDEMEKIASPNGAPATPGDPEKDLQPKIKEQSP